MRSVAYTQRYPLRKRLEYRFSVHHHHWPSDLPEKEERTYTSNEICRQLTYNKEMNITNHLFAPLGLMINWNNPLFLKISY
jgi:hypothetical protein